jgi:hypothetical protein
VNADQRRAEQAELAEWLWTMKQEYTERGWCFAILIFDIHAEGAKKN